MMRLCIFLLASLVGCSEHNSSGPENTGNQDTLKSDISVWISNPANGILFQQYNTGTCFEAGTGQDPAINVDSTVTFQTIDGFGNCLTGGSAALIHKMDQNSRTALLKELFDTTSSHIGISYLRISLGASDLSDHVYSYDDMPLGQSDLTLSNFSLDVEKTDLIPVLKEILAINPDIKILASPWSAPAWMKSNESAKGGSLKTIYFDAYAQYFVRYIKGMAAEGINIDAITIQNEPLNEYNNPSMYMSASDQAAFIKGSLGPAFQAESIGTKIIVYDHNADHTEYPGEIYSDPDAAEYTDGAAFHLYAGSIDDLSQVHTKFPAKNIYFTEQWVGAPGDMKADMLWHVKNLVIGGTRNWCRNVLEWNMASDPDYNPHTNGGCTTCLGTITLNGVLITRNPAYYILAHSAKFVRPGSVRIDSNQPENLPNVVFITPAGRKVLIAVNEASVEKRFTINFHGKFASLTLPGLSTGTFVW
jgi:glucosylceramidase